MGWAMLVVVVECGNCTVLTGVVRVELFKCVQCSVVKSACLCIRV